MLEVLGHFRGQEMLSAWNMDPYARDHPMWSERMALIEERVAAMEPGRPPSDADAYWHRRMVAKLDGFLDAPSETSPRNRWRGRSPRSDAGGHGSRSC